MAAIHALTTRPGRVHHPQQPVSGVDFAFDCIGIRKTMEQIVPACRTGHFGVHDGGTAVLVGVPSTNVELNAMDMLLNEKHFIGSIGGSCAPDRDFPRSWNGSRTATWTWTRWSPSVSGSMRSTKPPLRSTRHDPWPGDSRVRTLSNVRLRAPHGRSVSALEQDHRRGRRPGTGQSHHARVVGDRAGRCDGGSVLALRAVRHRRRPGGVRHQRRQGGTLVVDAIRGWSQCRASTRSSTPTATSTTSADVGPFSPMPSHAAHPRPRVTGHENVPRRFDRYNLTNGYNLIINARQFRGQFRRRGYGLAGEEAASCPKVAKPDVTYSDRLAPRRRRTRIRSAPRKRRNRRPHVGVDSAYKAICAGDFFIWNFPNAGNPQKVQRYPVEWAAAMRTMAAPGAELFLPAHGLPIGGAARIKRCCSKWPRRWSTCRRNARADECRRPPERHHPQRENGARDAASALSASRFTTNPNSSCAISGDCTAAGTTAIRRISNPHRTRRSRLNSPTWPAELKSWRNARSNSQRKTNCASLATSSKPRCARIQSPPCSRFAPRSIRSDATARRR